MWDTYCMKELMSKKEALQHIRTSEPNMPVYQRALVALSQADNQRTRLISWTALIVSILSLFANGARFALGK